VRVARILRLSVVLASTDCLTGSVIRCPESRGDGVDGTQQTTTRRYHRCNPENEVCPPPPPPGDCSPGFYRNHQELWFFVGTPYCDGPLQPTCFDLLFAMDPVNGCKGSNASCGRGAAAAYLNSVTGFDCDD
jgi:hypothetical protein